MGVNSLGIGSGVLTADVLDQLREADNAVIMKPIETKLELANQREEASKLLSGYMTTFKSSTASLGGENLYLGREVTGGDEFVSVSAKAGADLGYFNITDVVKAEKDVWNSASTFTDTKAALTTLGRGTLTISVGGKELDIPYNATTTIDDIRAAINDSTAIAATASNLKIGESLYSFSLTGDKLNEAITFKDSEKQLNTVKLIGNASAGDTYEWSDGTNSILVNLVDGETAEQSGARIVAAIKADPTLSGLYNVVATTEGFTIESVTSGTPFKGSSVSNGSQLSTETITNTGLAKQQETITLSGNAVSGDTFTWSDGTNSLTINLIDGQTPEETGATIANAINADPTLSALYTAVATTDGFKIESKTFGLDFAGSAISIGSQTSSSEVTTKAADTLANRLNLQNLQAARGASFNYNGVAITRSTNDIDDLINGVTITLNKTQGDNDTTSIKVGQNNTAIKTEMDLFVTNFNLLSSNLRDMTVYNQETNVAGVFNNESSIKSILGDLTSILTKTDSKGNSLFDYGINIDKSGVMTLDSLKFTAKLNEDPAALELLFRGRSEIAATETTLGSSEVIGIFQELDTKIFNYTGSGKILQSFSENLATSKRNLINEYDKQKANLDARYETMTKKFAAYDSMINKLNSQFSSLKMLIDAEANADN